MKDTWLLFIRHGETDWNRQRRMQGQMEIPLNQLGEKQAEQIGVQLKDFAIDVLYTSPLMRAHQTAKAIHKHHPNAPLFFHNDLKERSFGKLEGKLFEDIWQADPALLFEEAWNYPMFQIPGGERLIDVYNRGKKFLSEIMPNNEGKTIAIVSHGVTIHCLVCILLDLPLTHGAHFSLKNTSITLIKQPKIGVAELQTINNTFHLDADSYKG